jgi:hypothetical protein
MRANKFANIILISGILYFVSLLIYGCYRIAYYGLNKYYEVGKYLYEYSWHISLLPR